MVVVLSLLLIVFLTWYSTVRTGAYSLALLNKSLGDASLLLLAMVLVLGPLSRLYDVFDQWLPYRKELGIFSFLLGAIHVYLVMFPLARRGPFGFFTARPTEAYTGLLGLVVMLLLFIVSFESIKKILGMKRWWKLQYMGARIAGVALFAHLWLLKYSEWAQWLSGRAANLAMPSFPPANLLIEICAIFVLFTRISEIFPVRAARIVVFLLFLGTLGTTSWLFLRPV